MQSRVHVQHVEGRKLLGSARHHSVITDRMAPDGGSDLGCTSGELLLLAIGSCATGSLRTFLEDRGVHCAGLRVEVALEPSATAGVRDRIVISPHLAEHPPGVDDEMIRSVITSGGVTSRLQLGSEVEVRITRPATGG